MKRFYEKHMLLIELMAAIALTAIVVAIIERVIGRQAMEEMLKSDRQALYTTTAQVSASLVGFILAAVTVVLGFSQLPRLRILRQSEQYSRIFDVFFGAIKWLAVTTVWAFVALVLDTDNSPKGWVTYGLLALAAISSIRVYRCVWIMKQLTAAATGAEARSTTAGSKA